MIRCNTNDADKINIKGSYITVYKEFSLIFEIFVKNVLFPKYPNKEIVKKIITDKLNSVLEEL